MILDYFKNIKNEINDVTSMLKNTSVFNSNVINSSIDKNILSSLNMGYSSDGEMTSGYSSAIEKLATSYNKATAEANALQMVQDGLSESTVKDILAKQNWSDTERNAAINSQEFKNAQLSSTVAMNSDTTATWANVAATKALSIAKKSLSIIGGVALSAAISIGISALVAFVDSLYDTRKEIEATAESAKKSIDEIKDSFDELENTTNGIKERYAELSQGVDQLSGKNISLSTDDYNEFLDLGNQLAQLFPTLTKNYDANGNAILDLSGDVNSIVSSLDNLIERQRKLANEEILEEMPAVYEDYDRKINDYNKQLEDAKKKQEGYLELYNKLKNANYEVSEDKREVTFSFDNLNNDEKASIPEYFTSNIDDVNHYLMKDLDGGTTTLTLYLDEEFDGFEARLSSAQDEISKYAYKIKTEISSFSTYINTWLQDSWEYQQVDDTKMQTALQQVLFNKDWIAIAKKELGENAGFDQIFPWIEENYIKAINNLNNEEIRQDFINLFTLDLTPQDTINLAQKIQDYFKNNDIFISLDFILNAEDPNSTQNLVDRFYASRTEIAAYDPEGYLKLREYTKDFNESQMEAWLIATQGADNADEAILKYEESLNKVSNEDYNFFTDENLNSIDAYKEKISDLGSYLEAIGTTNALTSEQISELNTKYGIFADDVDGYKKAIIDLIKETSSSSEIMLALKEAIDSCEDETGKARLQSLYDSLNSISTEAKNSANSIYTLSDAYSSLESSASLLRDLDEMIQKTGKIDSSKIDEMLTSFPEMSEDIARFNAGLIDSQELFDLLVEAYETDKNNYAKSIAFKLEYNDTYYKNWVECLSSWIINSAMSYGVDLRNYANLNEAKLALDKEYEKRKAKLKSIALGETLSFQDWSALGNGLVSPENLAKRTYEEYKVQEEEVKNIEHLIDKIEDSFTTSLDIDTDWQKFGLDTSKDDDDTDEDSMTDIDWADQSLKVLQEDVDDAQTALEDTHGYDAQIEAITTLNSALKDLRSGYKKAQSKYSDRYTSYLAQLPDGEAIRKKIESGEEFDLSSYDSETAEIIQNAIDAYNKMIEAENKVAELTEQIQDNNKIEKSKVRQEKYETKLAGVQTDLDNNNLTASEKNSLLKQQLNYQNKINNELIKQAEYEGDILEIENLKKENKKNEREKITEHWQN